MSSHAHNDTHAGHGHGDHGHGALDMGHHHVSSSAMFANVHRMFADNVARFVRSERLHNVVE